jgi:formylglycine-generating enzyme required for sulfatase activity
MPRSRSVAAPSMAVLSLVAGIVAGCSGSPSASPNATTPAIGGQATMPASGAPTSGPASQPPGTPVASPERQAGTARDDSHGVAQVWVPGGVFTMGSEIGSATPPSWARNEVASERPAHDVAISRGYWIDTTEVTVAAFAAFKSAGGYEDQSLWSEAGWTWLERNTTKELPDPCVEQAQGEPQVCVTWYEAEAYAAWRGGRLPTEAEWEFAARGPESRVYPWGDEYDPTLANLDGGTAPKPVGSYPGGASWVGGLDMAGNAMEWVADWYSTSYYGEGVRDDPTGPAEGTIKVEKGGWWGPPDDAGAYIGRGSYRHFEDPPFYDDHHIGFRIVSLD